MLHVCLHAQLCMVPTRALMLHAHSLWQLQNAAPCMAVSCQLSNSKHVPGIASPVHGQHTGIKHLCQELSNAEHGFARATAP